MTVENRSIYNNNLEYELERILRPINPRPEFVSELHKDLILYPEWKIVVPSALRLLVIIFAAATSALLVVLTSARALFMVIGALKLFKLARTNQI